MAGLTVSARSVCDRSFNSYHKFGTSSWRANVSLGIFADIENELRDAIAITKVDEDKRAKVSTPVDPAHQQRGFASVAPAQFATGVRALKITQEIQFYFGHVVRFVCSLLASVFEIIEQ